MAKKKNDLLDKYSDGQYIENAPKDDDQEDSSYSPDEDDSITRLFTDWQSSRDFLAMLGLPSKLTKYEDYYEGRQDKYMPKGLPHIIVNVVKMIIENKISGILENPIQISYLSNMDMDSTLEMDRFSDYTLKNINFEGLDRKIVKDALLYGLGVAHTYWNEDAVGMDSIARGSMVCEAIHPLMVAVANPYEKDVQKQEWVIVASRESVARAKLMADDDVDKAQIVSDDNEVIAQQIELNEGRLVTVYTRYFRKDGEVYFEKGTKNVMLTKPVALNPYIGYAEIKNAKYDPTTAHSPDEKLEKFDRKFKTKWARYPIQFCVLNESANYYWGISDVDDIILGQNCINATYALSIKNGIDMQAKYIVRPDALRGQVITNEIGQVITNFSKHEDGIKQITGQATMTTEMVNLPLSLSEIIRKVKSASDLITGDIGSKELSGNAIALLQTAAERPTESQTRKNQLFAIEMGKTFLLYYKFFYEQAQYAYDINGFEKHEMKQKYNLPDDMEIPSRIVTRFNGSKYLDMSFDIQVEAGAGGRFSQINQLNFIQSFMQMMPNLDTNQQMFFIKATPSYILKDKKDLIAMIQEQQLSENAMLKQQLNQKDEMIQILTRSNQYGGQIIKFMKAYMDNYQKETGKSMSIKDSTISDLMKANASQEQTPVQQIEQKVKQR